MSTDNKLHIAGSPRRTRRGIELNGDELGTSENPTAIRHRAAAFARNGLAGSLVTNRATGEVIIIPWQGIKHTLAAKNIDTLRAIPAIRALLENGKRIAIEEPRHGQPGIKKVHRYVAELWISGAAYDVELVVRVTGDGLRFYDHRARRREKPAGTSGKPQEADSPQSTAGTYILAGNDELRQGCGLI